MQVKDTVWKWIAGILVTLVLAVGGTAFGLTREAAADKERLIKVEQAIIYLTETVKEIREDQKEMKRHHYADEHDR